MAKYVTIQYILKNTGGDAIEVHPNDFQAEYEWFENAYLSGKLIDFLVDGVSYKDKLEHLPEQGV